MKWYIEHGLVATKCIYSACSHKTKGMNDVGILWKETKS